MIKYGIAEIAFKEYLENYDLEDGSIKLKVIHTYKVVEKSEYIAKEQGLDEENVALAKLIALLHDIGRFKQVTLLRNFSDKGFDHADYGVKILFEENLIRKFIPTNKYDEIIKKAIYTHNKYKIEDGLNELEELHCKIIRDADKLDIFYVLCNYDFESAFWYKDFSCKEISDEIMIQCTKLHRLNYKDIKNNADQIAVPFAYVYDLNFDFSLKYLRDKKYLDEFTRLVCEGFESEKVHKQVKELLECVNLYMEKE